MSDLVEKGPIALKEWAITVQALAEGEQIMVMRKGGIIEETRDFELISQAFYLMPAHEHQKEHLLKDSHKAKLSDLLEQGGLDRDKVKLDAYAEVALDIEIRDQETLDSLRAYHIWTDTFAEERLKWKKTKPLHLLLLRVYKLETPIEIPMRDAYNGCKSWVRIEDKLPEGTKMTPALSDSAFEEQLKLITHALSIQPGEAHE
ncbi:DUF1802 family protein [Paenibacillus sp. GCM10023252]|uniref:DUF1802 family protein n=1 Tax=Paenibacillus sp. GCM10023252 TaxID=3252649 RepID=UPI003623E39F